jgi:putative transposase
VSCPAEFLTLEFLHFGETLRGGAGGFACLAGHLPMPEYRRRLPHFHPNDTYLFLTWRLWGSLPARADSTAYPTPGHAFAAADRVLDRRASGPRWLRDPRIADQVSHAVLIGERERHFYHLCAWVVMPNHVHLLILPLVPVPVLMRWLKGSTARSANRILGRTGKPFWQDESFDHYLRNSSQIKRTIADISPKTRFRPGWYALRSAGRGPVPAGRRNRLPHHLKM